MRILVRSVNDCPVSTAAPVSTLEDVSVAVALPAFDVEDDALRYTITAQPQHGVLAGTAPELTYTPALNYNGSDAFAYMVGDGRCTQGEVVVPITVVPVNDAPVAADCAVETAMRTPVTITPVFSDPDSSDTPPDVLMLTARVAAEEGSVVVQGAALVFTPAAAFCGTATVHYTVIDSAGAAATGRCLVLVSAIEGPPPPIEAGGERWIAVSAQGRAHTGTIVVNNDEWTMSDAGFENAPTVANFARNLGDWFKRGETGRFLVYSGNFGLVGNALKKVMTDAGHQWDIGTSAPLTREFLEQYDAIFLCGRSVDAQLLSEYAERGGCVYICGQGYGSDQSMWNPFLALYGLRYGSMNSVVATVPVGSSHPLLSNVASLFYYNGNDVEILPGGGRSNCEVIHRTGANILIAAFTTGQFCVRLEGAFPNPPPGFDSTTVTYRWEFVEGPGTVRFAKDNALATDAYCSKEGTYRLRLTASNGFGSSSADVLLHLELNSPPLVSAGTDQLVPVVERDIPLFGSVEDDNRPAGGPVTVLWSVVSAPLGASVTIARPESPQTTARCDKRGWYAFKLEASDTIDVSADTVAIGVGVRPVISPFGLSAWWPLDRHPREVINGNHDVVWSQTAEYDSGQVFAGVAMGGLTDFGKVAGHADLNVGASEAGMSMELWVRSEDTNRDTGLIQWSSATSSGVFLRAARAAIYAEFYDTEGVRHVLNADGVLKVGQWTHVAATYDRQKGEGRIYINGTLVKQGLLGVFTPQTTYDLYFGVRDRTANYFKGILDEIALYRRPLRSSEIQEIYKAGGEGRTMPGANAVPQVEAGAAMSLGLAVEKAVLAGAVVDDGQLLTAPLLTWSVLSGPGPVTFDDSGAAGTKALFSEVGAYVLSLSAYDGQNTASDLVEVRVGVSTVPVAGMAAWWPLNQHPHEVIRGNHDVEWASPNVYVPGQVLSGAACDGVYTFGQVAGHADLNVGTSEAGMTMELWVRSDDTSRDTGLIQWSSSASSGVLLRAYGKQIYAEFYDTAGVRHYIYVDGVLKAGEWTHVAATYDRQTGEGRIYANGTLVKQGSLGLFTPQTTYDLYFGVRDRTATLFKGMLDEIALYRRPLSPKEIQEIYKAGGEGRTMPGANAIPQVEAGPPVVLGSAGEKAVLKGTVVDDGRPLQTLAVTWAKISGPGTVTFDDTGAAGTRAFFSEAGAYILSLSAYDGENTASDLVEVRVGVSTVPVAGMAAWWPLNQHPHEVISGNHDVEWASPDVYVPGQVLSGAACDGVYTFGQVAGHADLNVGASEAGMTMELWVRSDDTSRDTGLIQWSSSAGSGVLLRAYGKQIYAEFYDTAGVRHYIYVDGVLKAGEWTHVAATYDRQTGDGRIYANGTLVKQGSLGLFTPQTTYDLYFGVRDRTATLFKGVLDEITLYRRPLLLSEIKAIYDAGSGGRAPVLNQPPLVAASSAGSVYVGEALRLSATASDDGLPNPPATLTYAWSKVSGPGVVTFAAADVLSTTATFDAVGTYTLRFTASDSEKSANAEVTVEVPERPSAPPSGEFVSPLDGSTIAAGTRLMLIVKARDSDGAIARVEFFLDGASLGFGGRIIGQADQYGLVIGGGVPVGVHVLAASVTDNTNLTVAVPPVTVAAAVPPSEPPVVSLTTPVDGATVTAPTAITGVAYSTGLASWEVEARMRSAAGVTTAWRIHATGVVSVGAPASGATPETSGQLGAFDPTNLLNGIYELQLRATDIAGRTVVTAPVSIVVEGRLKLGVLSEAFVETSLPAPGFPLEAIRHYDSRDTRIGDFGLGGTLANSDFRLQKSLALGEAWFAWSDTSGPAGFPAYMLDPAPPQEATGVPPAPRTITITLPTDVVYRFTARMEPRKQVGAPIRFGRMVFDPMPGTVGSLVPLDDSRQVDDEVMVAGDEGMLGTVDLIGYDDWLYDPKLFRLTLADGTAYLVDEVLGVVEMSDPNGNRIEYHKDRIVHSCGMELTLVRDSAGCITQVLDPAGNAINYTYDAQHRLISVTDRAGKATTFGYSGSSGLVTSVTPPAAVQPTFNVWDGFDRFVARVDGLLNRTELGHDPAGYKETKTDQLGNVTTYQMDDFGRMLAKTDPLGGVTRYAYGDSLNPFLHTAVTDPLGRVTRYVYNRQGLPTTVTDPLGNVTTYEYSLLGKPTKETDPLGNSVVTTYDSAGNTVAITDRDGARHTFTYDSTGNVLTAIDPLGEKTACTYNSQGLPLTEETRAADGTLVGARSFTYDIYGNRTAETTRVTKPDGTVQDVTIRHTYDLAGQPLITTFADGTSLIRTYDSAGQLASETDRSDHTTRHDYDAAGRRTKSSFWDGTMETTVYDAKGRSTSVTDRRGFVTATEYDALDRVTKTTLPDGTATAATYDLAGQLLSETDAAGNTTSVSYDLGGRPTTVTYPDGTTTEVAYDAAGNAAEVKPRVFLEAAAPAKASPTPARMAALPSTASGSGTPRYVFSFDAAHRITGIANPDGTTASIAYDQVGRPTSTTNERGATWTYEYCDSRAVARSRVAGPLGYAEKYTVNALACVTSRRDALGRETFFDYPVDKYQPRSISYGDGSTESFTYDEQGRTVRAIDRRGNSTDYSYAETSAKGAYTRTTTRLVTVIGSGSPETAATLYATTEEFDDFGNLRKTVEEDGLGTVRTTTHTYDWANRRTSTTLPDGKVIKTVYGPGGRIESVTESTADGDRRTGYAYDVNGHLTTVTHPDRATTGYSYAADGRLLSMTDARGGVTTYSYNDTAHIVYVTDPVGSTNTRTYDPLGNLLSEKDALGHATTYVYDELGRRTKVTDALGNSTTFAYDLAGNLVSAADPLGRVASYSGYDANNRPARFELTGSALAPGSAATGYAYDALGNRTALIDPVGRKTTFAYDQLSRLYSTMLPSGLVRSTRYDVAGNELARHEYDPADIAGARTVRQTFDAGNRLLTRILPPLVTAFGERPTVPEEHFTYDGFGRLATHRDVRLATTSYSYDGVTDRVSSVALPGGGLRSFEYDAMANPVSTTDARGTTTTQVFDASQRLKKRMVAGARTTTYGYDAVGNLTSVGHPSGQTIANTFDALRRLTSQTTLLDATTGQKYIRDFGYDAGGRHVSTTDANGATTRTYDAQDRELLVAEPLGRSLARTYNAAGDLLSTADARGAVTSYTYDSAGRLATETDAEGGVRSLVFDLFDQLVTEELGASRTTYRYDSYGRVVETTRHGGAAGDAVTANLWDASGLLRAVRDPAGYVTTHSYDPRGCRVGTDYPGGATETFTYDGEGNVLTATDANGHTRTFAYNPFGELEQVTEATGAVTTYTYDAGGRVASVTDPTSRKTAYVYDEAGRLKSTTLPDGTSVSTRAYDEFGNLTATTDPDGRRTLLEYDQLNRLVKAGVPLSANTAAESRYGYDTANNLASILDPLNRLSTFAHDKVGRLTAVYLPRSGATPHERFEYEARGLPTRRTDASGYATTMAYDALGRLVQTVPDARRGEPAISYSYDSRGLRTRMTDALGATTYAYDSRGRLLTKTTPFAGTLSHSYDAAGNLISLSSSIGGVSLGYTYDGENRLTKVTSTGAASMSPSTTVYSRDRAGRLTGAGLPNGLAETRTHDANGLLASVTTGQGDVAQTRFAVGRKASGLVEQLDEELAGVGVRRVAFGYDLAGRLVTESASLGGVTGSLDYSLDAAGNRLARRGQLGALGAQTFAFDENNALIDGVYDGNGNTASAHSTQPAGGFGYDFRDALRTRTPALTTDAARVEFLHDGDGRRVGRRVLDPATGRWKTTHYLVAELNPTGIDQVLAEVREDSLERSFAYGEQRLSIDGFVEHSVRGGRHSLALDASGNVWAWGDNSQGQLGLGNTDGSRDAPVQIPGLANVAALAAGRFHSVALRNDGTVWIWGGHDRGQLGLGAGVTADVPTQIVMLEGIVAVATYLDHTLALDVDGGVWVWGANDRGQLGDGTTIDQPVPVRLAGLVATEIAAGQIHSAACTAEGAVAVWGDNTHGQLGSGVAGSFSATPSVVAGLTSVDRLVAGGFHTLVRRADGTVLAWGGNAFGQLGDGSKRDRAAPVSIAPAVHAVALAAGSRHSLALLGDGTVLAWGDNREGQLGLGSVADSTTPERIAGLAGVSEIAAGGRRSLARSGSTLLEWGDGQFAPQSTGGDLMLATLGGEAGADPLGYGLGLARAFYAYDPLGNVRALADDSGALTDTYTYDAFGNLLSPSSATTRSFNPYLFQGERFEAAAGLYHLRARDYDPSLGRFQQLDRFAGVPGQPFSHNRYAYAEADPVNLHDPSGHYAVTVWGAVQLLQQQADYNAFLADIGPKEQLLDLGALTGNYAYVMGPRPQVVQRERPVWLMAAGSGSIVGDLGNESGSINDMSGGVNYSRGLDAGSSVFFLVQTGAPHRQSVVERLVDSAWVATQRAWPNLNTGPKLPDDFRAKLSVKWQNRWPDVLYHNAILQGSLRSALLGREVEAYVTATFRAPSLLPRTRSAMALRSLAGSAGGGPLDWRAPAASPQGAFLSHISASGWEYGQMEMMQEWQEAVQSSGAYRAAYVWAEVGVRLPGEAALMGASLIPGVGEALDVHSSLYGETAVERNLALFSLGVAAVSGGLSPNFGRIGRAIGEIGGELSRLSRRGGELAGRGATSALRAAERASLAAARHGARAVSHLAGGARMAGNYAAAFERGYLRGVSKYAGQLNSGIDPTPFFDGLLNGAREARALHNAPRITAEVADTASDLARTERHATAALTDAAENAAPRLTQSVGDLRAAGLKDAHHVIQDAAVRDLPGYSTRGAPGVRLPGPSTAQGTPHYVATQIQRGAGGGTYAAERAIGYKALRRAGYSEAEARQIIAETDAWFQSIGVSKTTPTRIPGNRN
ncbi:MAG: Ig-like domain-containing protein [Opitutaceae bacterium]